METPKQIGDFIGLIVLHDWMINRVNYSEMNPTLSALMRGQNQLLKYVSACFVFTEAMLSSRLFRLCESHPVPEPVQYGREKVWPD